jgi:hypothetical protein
MKMTPQTLLSALLLAAIPCLAPAQTQAPAKPAAKSTTKAAAKPAPAPAAAASAAGDKTLSLGGKSGSGPILTRDELRTCLSQEEIIRKRLDAHLLLRPPLDKEKADLAAGQQALRAERAPLEELKQQSEALGEKFKAYAVRAKAYEERVQDFNTANPTGAKGERERAALVKDRVALDAERPLLEAEKAAFTAKSETMVRDYNAKAAALDLQVTTWNQRNEQWNQNARSLEADRSEWVIGCADRRYREDDEIAIKRGK